jgi:hypothetical protein
VETLNTLKDVLNDLENKAQASLNVLNDLTKVEKALQEKKVIYIISDSLYFEFFFSDLQKKKKMVIFGLEISFFFSFCCSGKSSGGKCSRQVFYHLSHPPSPFLFQFLRQGLTNCPGWL